MPGGNWERTAKQRRRLLLRRRLPLRVEMGGEIGRSARRRRGRGGELKQRRTTEKKNEIYFTCLSRDERSRRTKRNEGAEVVVLFRHSVSLFFFLFLPFCRVFCVTSKTKRVWNYVLVCSKACIRVGRELLFWFAVVCFSWCLQLIFPFQ